MAPNSPTYHAEIHRWHDSTWGVLTAILLTGSLLTLLWGGQKRPLVAQFFVIGMLFFLLGPIIFGQFDPALLIISLLIIALFIATYPVPRELLSFSRQGAWSIGLLALSAVALVVVIPDIWHNISLQLIDSTSEHAKGGHWYLSATLSILLLVAGLLASTKRAGWAVLGMITGIAFLYLGMAAISLPFHPGSWGTIGGVLALLAGIAYIGITIFEARRAGQPAPTNIAEPMGGIKA